MLFDFLAGLFPKKDSATAIKPVVLMVLDGFGLAPPSSGNAIAQANMPFYRELIKTYPNSELIASGESVGLPANEVGNTEVGHLTMGAGRVILQDLKRIDKAIEDGSFFDNRALITAGIQAKKNNSKLHLVGLLGSGNVHSSKNHIYSLLQFCKKEGIEKVFLHLFTDGRDSPPKEAASLIEELEEYIKGIGVGRIATVCGRYYGMDRDRRWERIEKAYKMMVLGVGAPAPSAKAGIDASYQVGITDEFIEPIVVAKDGLVESNDSIVFFNFRIDRARQLAMSFVLPDFERLTSFDFGFSTDKGKIEGKVSFDKTFDRQKICTNLFTVSMTEYHQKLPVSQIAFGPEEIAECLSVVLSQASLTQLHMAESEKQRFVTYYFDGMREAASPHEDTVIVPSQKVATYDLKPEMSLPALANEFNKALDRRMYNFILINIANPDMVAHSGNLKASIKACEILDKYLVGMVNKILANSGTLIITGDHGNAEELLTFPTASYFVTSSQGVVNTDHSNNPVPIIFVSEKFKNSKIQIPKGSLVDIAPTVLNLLGVQAPVKMTGKSLLS